MRPPPVATFPITIIATMFLTQLTLSGSEFPGYEFGDGVDRCTEGGMASRFGSSHEQGEGLSTGSI
jgi:hypothetical protein